MLSLKRIQQNGIPSTYFKSTHIFQYNKFCLVFHQPLYSCDYITYQMMREVFYFWWFTFQCVIAVRQRGDGVGTGQMVGFFRSQASPGKVWRGRRGQADRKSLPMNSYSIIAHCTQTYAWKKRNVRFQRNEGMRQLPWT